VSEPLVRSSNSSIACPQPLHEEEMWSEPRTIDSVMEDQNENPEADGAESEHSSLQVRWLQDTDK
jgi:hypothetical protein